MHLDGRRVSRHSGKVAHEVISSRRLLVKTHCWREGQKHNGHPSSRGREHRKEGHDGGPNAAAGSDCREERPKRRTVVLEVQIQRYDAVMKSYLVSEEVKKLKMDLTGGRLTTSDCPGFSFSGNALK